MRTLATRAGPLVIAVAVVLAVAVVALASQPTRIERYSGAVPDVQCPAGVTPAQSFCYVTEPPLLGSKMPDTNVPPEPSQAVPVSPPPGIVWGSATPYPS